MKKWRSKKHEKTCKIGRFWMFFFFGPKSAEFELFFQKPWKTPAALISRVFLMKIKNDHRNQSGRRHAKNEFFMKFLKNLKKISNFFQIFKKFEKNFKFFKNLKKIWNFMKNSIFAWRRRFNAGRFNFEGLKKMKFSCNFLKLHEKFIFCVTPAL